MADYRTLETLPRLPLEGGLDLTYRCNNRCRHCWLWEPDTESVAGRELSVDEIHDIVEAARSLGCRTWDISGGEPIAVGGEAGGTVMQRVSERHFGVLGAAFLLVALVLLLALSGIAGAKTRIAPRDLVPDVTAPVTTDNSGDVFGYCCSLLLMADDGVYGSGVEATFYSIDGGAWQVGRICNFSVHHKRGGYSAGLHTIDYYSVDMIGNVETLKTGTITH